MEPPPASECEHRYEEHKSIKACIFLSESVHEIENHHIRLPHSIISKTKYMLLCNNIYT